MIGVQDVHRYSNMRANLGKVQGVIPITILGDHSDVSTAQETMWAAATLSSGAQPHYIRKSTETNLTIQSTSAADSYPSGIGVRTVKLGLIREDGTPYEAVVRMNGLTQVSVDENGSAFPGIACNYMNPELVGTNPAIDPSSGDDPSLINTNQGHLILRHGTDIVGIIQQGTVLPVGITRQAVFTVPKGFTFLLDDVKGNAGKDDDISVYIYGIDPVNGLYVRQLVVELYENFSKALNGSSIPFPENRLIEAKCLSSVVGTKTATIELSGRLVINEFLDKVREQRM